MLKRVDGRRAMIVQSDVEPGLLVDDRTRALRNALAAAAPDPAVEIRFKGEDADQQEAGEFLVRAPSTQWWTQLSSVIAGGLSFATLLTLILTPALLVLGDNVGRWLRRRLGGRAGAVGWIGVTMSIDGLFFLSVPRSRLPIRVIHPGADR